ncbi:MAG: hypothetical protein EZS28_006390 [Streblomastix strix]|uniref:Uncharacterized protein n=1 Tax=Streblomastix strix TaxID=222440 RepID=A0A5J4WT25_9EUKA|nr:MAG: hypothetical protein EZS28_006390 [Streblomastix strix]
MICFRREQEKGGVCSDSWVSKVQLRIYRASHIAFGTLPDSLVKSRGHSLFKRKFSAVAFTNVLEKLQQLYWKEQALNQSRHIGSEIQQHLESMLH